ncbi:uncharacterized protein MELLADRAFT_70771 [Melampsora larici-populina 98AG31]|uniref:Secreted protein n=1 Tax=Melampsora larici-populina (strain 98AG31 / pathotype 3-4-7) TaxID=747676 RepID=F4R7Q7_MELLP|nr:uncharacterized protein MELLADRAFT_70771 [Melampsora larici-populina 98AG31]EGG11741.1 secreted protein [Melampsora larici-populina 98AG31]
MRTSFFTCVTLIIVINGLIQAMPIAHGDQDHPDILSAYISPADRNQFNLAKSAHQLPQHTTINTDPKDSDPNGLLLRTRELKVAQPNQIEAKHDFLAIRTRNIAALSIGSTSDDDSDDLRIVPLFDRVGNFRSTPY